MDPLSYFPTEMFERILTSLNGDDIGNIILVSKHWYNFINDDDFFWKSLCRNFDSIDITSDITQNLPWKEIFLRNFGKNGVVKRWKEGRYCCISCYEDIPDNFICELDVDTWGYLLDIETSR